jgi:site-specific recombinase XerC
MASVVTRKHKSGERTYKVQWLLGGSRGAPWQSETFSDRRAALKFRSLVDVNGQRWPEGWVKGVGFATVAEDVEPPPEHPLLEFGTAYVRRLTSAGPDTQTKYVQQLTSLNGWLTAIKRSAPTVENVTSDDDRDWIVARRKAGASPKTIANYHGLLAAVFKSAVEKGLIARNPCEGVKLPPIDDDTEDDEDKVFLTEKEFALLRSCMHESDRDFLTVAVGTGLRWGELTAIKLKDLNLDGTPATLTVRRAWKTNGRGHGGGSRWHPSWSRRSGGRSLTAAQMILFSGRLGAVGSTRATGTRVAGNERSRRPRRRACPRLPGSTTFGTRTPRGSSPPAFRCP